MPPITPRSTPLVLRLIAYTEETPKLKRQKDRLISEPGQRRKNGMYMQLVNVLLYEAMNAYLFHIKNNKAAVAQFQEFSVEEQEAYVQHYLEQCKF